MNGQCGHSGVKKTRTVGKKAPVGGKHFLQVSAFKCEKGEYRPKKRSGSRPIALRMHDEHILPLNRLVITELMGSSLVKLQFQALSPYTLEANSPTLTLRMCI